MASSSTTTRTTQDDETLKKNARQLYKFFDTSNQSTLRGIIRWQAAGGMTYVTDVFRRLLESFRYHGNSQHEGIPASEVDVEDCVAAVLSRHSAPRRADGGDSYAEELHDRL